MELRQLKDVVALAEELHFDRAAVRVSTDQSGLSRRIRELEHDLGDVPLFHRTARGAKITDAGIALLPYARNILATMAQAKRAVRETVMGVRKQLRIGVCDEVWVKNLARLLSEHQANEPAVDIQLVDEACVAVIRGLETGALDIGLSQGVASERGLRSIGLWTDHLCAVLPPQHPLALQSEVSIEAIAGEPLILGHQHCSCGARADVDRFIGAFGAESRVEHAANLNDLRALVGAGQGIGLITEGQAESIFASDVTIRPLKERSFLRRTYVLHRADDESPLVSRFVDLARRST